MSQNLHAVLLHTKIYNKVSSQKQYMLLEHSMSRWIGTLRVCVCVCNGGSSEHCSLPPLALKTVRCSVLKMLLSPETCTHTTPAVVSDLRKVSHQTLARLAEEQEMDSLQTRVTLQCVHVKRDRSLWMWI